MGEENKRTLAVIPCLNEEATIGSVVLKAKRYVDEVVVIDDGCSDDTKRVAEEAGAIVVSHQINRGKSAGIKTGFWYALENDFDYVITLDGDGQHNADEIPSLLGRILIVNGVDVSLGIRAGDDTEMPMWRRVGKRVLDYTTSFGNGGLVTDSQCGFRAFNRKRV
jgi:glycosyltransferase involved in cell wall biosynthesis